MTTMGPPIPETCKHAIRTVSEQRGTNERAFCANTTHSDHTHKNAPPHGTLAPKAPSPMCELQEHSTGHGSSTHSTPRPRRASIPGRTSTPASGAATRKHNTARVQMRARANKRGSQRQGRYQAQPPPWAPETGTEAAYLGPVRRGTASAGAAACPLNFCETSCCARDFPHGHAKALVATVLALVTVW